MPEILERALSGEPTVGAVTLAPPGGRVVRSELGRKILTFAMVMGPGLIVMVADNDAGAVSTYTAAGAKYGTSLLWLLLLLLPCTYFIQEMVVRLGIATGEGHAAMIYKRFGKWWGVFSLCDLLIVNFLTLVTEFAAIDLAMRQLGVQPWIAVPGAAAALVVMVSTASFRRWERISLILCAFNLTWIGLAVMLGPSAKAAVADTFIPHWPQGGVTGELVFLIIAIVGTTIAPWQLFFQQSCIADKKLRFADVKWARLDTFFGAIFVVAFAACMMFAGYGLHRHGVAYSDPAQMATELGRIMSPWVGKLLLLLMVNAAVLGAVAISLASAWAYGEVKGWESSLQKSVKEAPAFYGFYALSVFAAAGIVLIPNAPLQLIILSVQVLAGVMLPSAIIFLQLLLNDRELLGEFANKPWNNWVNWIIIAVLFGLSMTLAAQVLVPGLFPGGAAN